MSQSDQPEWFEFESFTARVDVPIQLAGVVLFFSFVACLYPPRDIILYFFSAISIETHLSSAVHSKKRASQPKVQALYLNMYTKE